MSEWWSKDREYTTSLGRDALDFLEIAGAVLGTLFGILVAVTGVIYAIISLHGAFGGIGLVSGIMFVVGMIISMIEFFANRDARYRRRRTDK